jgi:hypothetical protein
MNVARHLLMSLRSSDRKCQSTSRSELGWELKMDRHAERDRQTGIDGPFVEENQEK